MNPKLESTIRKFLLYADEIERGYTSLARLYAWVFGEQYEIKQKKGFADLQEVEKGDKCYAPLFYNAAKSIHYMHKMSYLLLYEMIPFIQGAPVEYFLDETEEREYNALKDEPSRITFKRRYRGRVNKWADTTSKSKEYCTHVFEMSMKLEREFVAIINVKYGKPLDDEDVRRYLEKKKLNCEEDKV